MNLPGPPQASSPTVPLGTSEQGRVRDLKPSFRSLLGATPCERSWEPNESICHLELPQPREPAGLCNPALPPSLARKSNKAGQASGVWQSRSVRWHACHPQPAVHGASELQGAESRSLLPDDGAGHGGFSERPKRMSEDKQARGLE